MTPAALPEPVERAASALRRELDAEVEVEPVAPNRFRLGVVTRRFAGVGHLHQQDMVWAIVDRVLSREESLRISVILAYLPDELEPAGPSEAGN